MSVLAPSLRAHPRALPRRLYEHTLLSPGPEATSDDPVLVRLRALPCPPSSLRVHPTDLRARSRSRQRTRRRLPPQMITRTSASRPRRPACGPSADAADHPDPCGRFPSRPLRRRRVALRLRTAPRGARGEVHILSAHHLPASIPSRPASTPHQPGELVPRRLSTLLSTPPRLSQIASSRTSQQTSTISSSER